MDDGRRSSAPEPTAGGEGAAHLLSNGRYAVLVTPAGSGYSALDGYALTRWTADPTRDADGFFLYIRDLGTGAVWSAGYQPTRHAPAHYEVRAEDGCVEIVRVDDNVEARTRIFVAAQHDIEIRRVTLTNQGAGTRRLELTSYAEVVLNTPAADAGHPAFSKLFVQTAYLPEHQALLAWRRLRSPDDRPLWLLHRLDVQGAGESELEYETDRVRFIGRGRTLAAPQALDPGARLAGTTGNVLDSVLSLRRVVELAPGASAQVTMALGAGETRGAVEALSTRLRNLAALEHATAAPVQAKPVLGVPEVWLGGVRLTTSQEYAPLPGSNQAIPPPKQPSELSAPGVSEPLLFFNGFGGFSHDGREYVIRVAPGEDGRAKLPPLPWTNVVANEVAGF
ncbi:MAG: GH94, partial [uncultured Gemmatimonadetes bacterium]